MWEFLAISHATITANESLASKPYFFWGLLSNPSDLIIPVDSISIILGIFDPFSPSQDCISLDALDDC